MNVLATSEVRMRTITWTTLLASTLVLTAFTGASEQLTLTPQSRLWVDGTSTVRDFTCRAPTINAIVDTRGADASTAVLSGKKSVLAVDVKVSVEKMDCGNGTMNEHMRNALKADENPTILFRMGSYEIAPAGDGATGTLHGTLSLGGTQKPITIVAKGQTEGGLLHVVGSTDVKMTDYNLTPPSLMFGRIKVSDKVTVKFDLYLKG
jgi:polyisoprenoid-binding protein YceI